MLHLLLALACRTKDTPDSATFDSEAPLADEDGDGFTEDVDCDDTDAAVNPDSLELCDGIDNDCDGTVDVDAGDAPTWYTDADEDGHGDASAFVQSCDQPSGTVDNDGDCDDTSADFHPGATEDDCTDPNDYNCDGSVAYADEDGDGWVACEECDDADADVHPDADEVCDGIDNDCDGATDPSDSLDALTWYADVDEDTYGDPEVSTPACEQPAGYVFNDEDCDDTDADLNPETVWYADADTDGYGDPDSTTAQCEQPSGYLSDDSDCDDTDADLNPETVWYADADTDGYGDADSTTAQCEQPTGYVADATDCDDTDDGLNPDTVWYADTDTDGYGDADSTTAQCEQPSGYVDDDSDCDDTDADLNPDTVWYADTDTDGYGDATSTTAQCEQPSGYLADDTDCDDTDGDTNPGADEYCDGHDDDCDGSVDEDDAVDVGTWYADTDGDTYGDASTTDIDCDQPSGYVSDDTDCDDSDGTVNPDTEWYPDLDGDTYGAEIGFESCQDWLDAGYDTDGVYAVLPFGDETTLDVYCDMTEDDGGWTLLLHQDLDTGGLFASDSEAALVNEADPENGLYSILDHHTSFQNSSGEYELRLTWPDEDLEIQHWSQTSDLDASSVTGYTAIEENYTAKYWGGMELSTSGNSYLDGSVSHSNWWYSIGAQSLHSSGIPGPGVVVDQVSLWVRKESASVATSVTQCASPTDWVQDTSDCDDSRNQTYDGAAEVCDGVSNDCSDTAWTDDAGLASFQDSSDAWTDYTSTLGAGTSASPAAVTLSTQGTLNVCEGTWYVNLKTTTSVDIIGVDGAKNVYLNGGGSGRVLEAGSTGDVLMQDLYVSDGYSANGGCINVYGPESFTFDGGYIVDCESTSTGGAIRTYGVEEIVLRDVHIDGPIAAGYGGAMYIYDTESLEFDGVTISDATGGTVGGAFFVHTIDELTWTDVRIEDNEATSQAGAGYIQYVTEATWDDVVIDGNSAPSAGGVFAYNMDDWVITGLEVTDTSNTTNAGGVYIGYSVVELYESEISDNLSSGYGAGFSAYYATVTMDEVEFSHNYGGGTGGALRSSNSDLTLTDVVFDGNEGSNGAGLYVTGSGYTVDCTDCWFDDNVTSGDGAAVYVNSGTYESTTSDYLTNEPNDVYVSGDGEYDYGTSESFTCDTTSGCY